MTQPLLSGLATSETTSGGSMPASFAPALNLPGHQPELLANLTLWRMWAVKLDDSELSTARAELTRYEKTLTGRTAEELQVVRIIDLVVSEGARRFFRL